jgi:hypothetical protein
LGGTPRSSTYAASFFKKKKKMFQARKPDEQHLAYADWVAYLASTVFFTLSRNYLLIPIDNNSLINLGVISSERNLIFHIGYITMPSRISFASAMIRVSTQSIV